jgi:MFS transporter, ACS family, hexuronate transporter
VKESSIRTDLMGGYAHAEVKPVPRSGATMLKVSLNAFSVFQLTHGNYVPVFLLAGSAYVVAIAVIHLLAPRLAAVVMD